jgi:hypothetical protein
MREELNKKIKLIKDTKNIQTNIMQVMDSMLILWQNLTMV